MNNVIKADGITTMLVMSMSVVALFAATKYQELYKILVQVSRDVRKNKF